MPVTFSEVVRHGKLTIPPAVKIAFEDDGAEDYFVAAKWASKVTGTPDITYPEGSVEIDPATTFIDGTPVLAVADVKTEAKGG